MADRISISPQELNDAGASLISGAETIEELMTTLNTTVEGLRDNWSGDAQVSYFAEFDAQKTNISQFQSMISNFGAQLQAIATTIEQADAELSNALSGQ